MDAVAMVGCLVCISEASSKTDWPGPNVLRISRAAPIDREDNRAKFTFQNSPDLVAATAASGCMRGLGRAG